MQATSVSETPGLRRSVLASAIAQSDDPALVAAIVGLLELTGRARREEATTRMKVLGATLDAPVLGRDVATVVGIDASTASRHIAVLEADGLVERHSDLGDRRAHPIAATAAGRSVYEASLRERLSAIAGAVADWDEADRDQLARLLGRLVADIARQHPTTPAERDDA